jgi:hypothetical protein
MELVPLDPEVSERGGERAPAAGEPGSAQGRGGPRRRCSPASALRSLAHCSAPPPCALSVRVQGTVPPSAECLPSIARREGPHGTLRSTPTPRICPTRQFWGAVRGPPLVQTGRVWVRCLGFWDSTSDKDHGTPHFSQCPLPRALTFPLTLGGLPLWTPGSCGI